MEHLKTSDSFFSLLPVSTQLPALTLCSFKHHPPVMLQYLNKRNFLHYNLLLSPSVWTTCKYFAGVGSSRLPRHKRLRHTMLPWVRARKLTSARLVCLLAALSAVMQLKRPRECDLTVRSVFVPRTGIFGYILLMQSRSVHAASIVSVNQTQTLCFGWWVLVIKGRSWKGGVLKESAAAGVWRFNLSRNTSRKLVSVSTLGWKLCLSVQSP